MMASRDEMRRMAAESLAQGDATGWFERFYQQAGGDWDRVPWADREPNPYLVAWLRTFFASPTRKRCLVVGCGLGDDAEALASAGFEVTGVDISPTAIEAAQRRFPRSGVDYVVGDILQPPASWRAAFDLVFEAFTLQALPPEPRHAAIASIASLVGSGGRVFVLCRAREADEPTGELPWPLTRAELGLFEAAGLRATSVDIVLDEAPPVRRFRAFFDRLEP
ncbi:MAG: class I SAM-dependent methyltransferase [Vicinamibacteraceae bacterium]